jgi:hypothetical protein
MFALPPPWAPAPVSQAVQHALDDEVVKSVASSSNVGVAAIAASIWHQSRQAPPFGYGYPQLFPAGPPPGQPQ